MAVTLPDNNILSNYFRYTAISGNAQDKPTHFPSYITPRNNLSSAKLIKLHSSIWYEFAINITSVFNLLGLALREQFTTWQLINYWIIVQICLNLLFTFEMISDWVVFGIINSYRNSFRIWSESASMLFNIIGIVMYAQTDPATNISDIYSVLKLFEFTIFLRLIRVLTLLYEDTTFRNIIETMRNLLGPFWSLLMV